MQYNNKLNELQQDFNEEVWNAFHGAEINDHDDFYEYMHVYIDNSVIYYANCEAILENNSDYHYNEHDLFGRPNSLLQQTTARLLSCLMALLSRLPLLLATLVAPKHYHYSCLTRQHTSRVSMIYGLVSIQRYLLVVAASLSLHRMVLVTGSTKPA